MCWEWLSVLPVLQQGRNGMAAPSCQAATLMPGTGEIQGTKVTWPVTCPYLQGDYSLVRECDNKQVIRIHQDGCYEPWACSFNETGSQMIG